MSYGGGVSKAEEFTVTIKCNNKIHDGFDCGATLTLTFKVTPDKHDPTCTEQGYTLYTLAKKAAEVKAAAEAVAVAQKVTLCDKDTYPEVNKDVNEQCEQRVDGEPATGHTYTATWTWQEDYTYSAEKQPTLTVTLTCGRDCGETKVVTVPVGDHLVIVEDEGRKDAQCTEDGSVTFTATLTYTGLAEGQLTTNSKTYTIAQLGHALVEGDFHDLGEGQHGQKCSRCEQYVNPAPHDELVWHTDVATTTHYKKCPTCDYIDDSTRGTCSIEEGNLTSEKCTECEHQYADEITIYLHQNSTTTWAADKIYLWAYIENGTKSLYDEYPGRLGLFTACEDSTMSGWVEAKITVARGHLNKDLYVVANLGNDAAQTGNIQITNTTMYISKNLDFNKGYTSKTLATNAEDATPSNGNYFLTGCFNGVSASTGYSPNVTTWERVFREEKDYTIEGYFRANDTFRIRKNVSNWNAASSNFTFYNMTIVGAADGINTSGLLTRDTSGSDNNIKVTKACRLRITFKSGAASSQKIQIYVIALSTASHTHKLGEIVPESQGTCTDKGLVAHYRCSCGLYYNLERRVVDLAALQTTTQPDNHSWQKASEGKDPTCTDAGYKAYYKCDYCHKFAATDDHPSTLYATETEVQQAEGVAIEATGHTYTLAEQDTYSWSDLTATSAKLTVNYTCRCGVTHSVEFEITSPLTRSDANCEDDKKVYFTHQADAQAVKNAAKDIQDKDTFVGFELQTSEDFTIEDTHLGHTYVAAETPWTWGGDHESAIFHLVCNRDGCQAETTEHHTHDIADIHVEPVTSESDCTTPSSVTYTATITEEQINANIQELDSKNIFTKGETALTFSEKSSDDVIPGHIWVVKEYSWEEDTTGDKTSLKVTVTLKCDREKETENTITVTFTIEGDVTDATCTENQFTTYMLNKSEDDVRTQAKIEHDSDGKLTLKDTFCVLSDEHVVTKNESAKGHDFGAQPYVPTEDGSQHYQKCKNCEEYNDPVDHNYGDTWYQDEVASQGHHQICSDCQHQSESQTHTYTEPTEHVAGTHTHQQVCECGYKATATNCSNYSAYSASSAKYKTWTQGGTCSDCGHDYTRTVTVWFHKPTSWTGTIHAHKFVRESATKSTSTDITSWPGDTISSPDTANAGWYKTTVTLNELFYGYVIYNNNNNHQTGSIMIAPGSGDELWISNRLNGFATKALAEADESKSSLTYTLYVYAPKWSSVYVHAWSDSEGNSGPFVSKAGQALDPLGSHWFKLEATGSSTYLNQSIVIIFKPNSSNWEQQVNFKDNEAGKLTLLQQAMFINVGGNGWNSTNDGYFKQSWADVGATTIPSTMAGVSSVSTFTPIATLSEEAPVQVATLPPQLSKSYLAPALAA